MAEDGPQILKVCVKVFFVVTTNWHTIKETNVHTIHSTHSTAFLQ